MIKIIPIHALKDNLIWLIHDESKKNSVVIDPSEAEPVLNYLDVHNLNLIGILNTHHHFDHVGGNIALQKRFLHAPIYCSQYDKDRVPYYSHISPVVDSSEFKIESFIFKTLSVPGHTLGHILYHLENNKSLFSGDTLFSLGCGRLFEGTASQMWSSLERIMKLPQDTQIYCGHEYTLSNLRFAQSLEPDNLELNLLNNAINQKIDKYSTSLPTTLEMECKYNPFLKLRDSNFREKLKMSQTPYEAFAQLRELKNSFTG